MRAMDCDVIVVVFHSKGACAHDKVGIRLHDAILIVAIVAASVAHACATVGQLAKVASAEDGPHRGRWRRWRQCRWRRIPGTGLLSRWPGSTSSHLAREPSGAVARALWLCRAAWMAAVAGLAVIDKRRSIAANADRYQSRPLVHCPHVVRAFRAIAASGALCKTCPYHHRCRPPLFYRCHTARPSRLAASSSRCAAVSTRVGGHRLWLLHVRKAQRRRRHWPK